MLDITCIDDELFQVIRTVQRFRLVSSAEESSS